MWRYRGCEEEGGIEAVGRREQEDVERREVKRLWGGRRYRGCGDEGGIEVVRRKEV